MAYVYKMAELSSGTNGQEMVQVQEIAELRSAINRHVSSQNG